MADKTMTLGTNTDRVHLNVTGVVNVGNGDSSNGQVWISTGSGATGRVLLKGTTPFIQLRDKDGNSQIAVTKVEDDGSTISSFIEYNNISTSTVNADTLYAGTIANNVNKTGNITIDSGDYRGGTKTGKVYFPGGSLQIGTASSGKSGIINFGDGDFVHICEPADDTLELKGSRINFVTNNLQQNGAAISLPNFATTAGSMVNQPSNVSSDYKNYLKFTTAYGNYMIAWGVNNLGNSVRTITFPTSFGYLPTVTISGTNWMGARMPGLISVTPANFQVRMNGSMADVGESIGVLHWIAMGKMS